MLASGIPSCCQIISDSNILRMYVILWKQILFNTVVCRRRDRPPPPLYPPIEPAMLYGAVCPMGPRSANFRPNFLMMVRSWIISSFEYEHRWWMTQINQRMFAFTGNDFKNTSSCLAGSPFGKSRIHTFEGGNSSKICTTSWTAIQS